MQIFLLKKLISWWEQMCDKKLTMKLREYYKNRFADKFEAI